MRWRLIMVMTSLVVANAALAHEGLTHDSGRLPSANAWNAVIAISLVVLTAGYAIGLRRLWRLPAGHTVIPRWRAVVFCGGLAAIVIALLSSLDWMSDTLFSAHMVQHEILMLAGAPLMVLGRPFIAVLWAFRPSLRKSVAATLRMPTVMRVWQRLSGPFTVLLLQAVVLWGWHMPFLFELALHHEGIHVLQHLSFFLTAALFWWALVHGRYGRLGYGVGVLYVFGTALHSEVLGALLTFDSRALYATHAARTAASGLDPIADQQLAGVLMWIPFGAVFVLIGLAMFAAWIGETERRTKIADVAVSLHSVGHG